MIRSASKSGVRTHRTPKASRNGERVLDLARALRKIGIRVLDFAVGALECHA